MTGQFVAGALSLVGCFVLLCRVDKMLKGVTKPIVFAQHAVLAVGLFGGFLLNVTGEGAWAAASIAAGVLSFFLMSMGRWRHAAPEGTAKPGDLGPYEIDSRHFRYINGGRQDN